MQLVDLIEEALRRRKERDEREAKALCTVEKIGKQYYIPLFGKKQRYRTLRSAETAKMGAIAFIEDVIDEPGSFYIYQKGEFVIPSLIMS